MAPNDGSHVARWDFIDVTFDRMERQADWMIGELERVADRAAAIRIHVILFTMWCVLLMAIGTGVTVAAILSTA